MRWYIEKDKKLRANKADCKVFRRFASFGDVEKFHSTFSQIYDPDGIPNSAPRYLTQFIFLHPANLIFHFMLYNSPAPSLTRRANEAVGKVHQTELTYAKNSPTDWKRNVFPLSWQAALAVSTLCEWVAGWFRWLAKNKFQTTSDDDRRHCGLVYLRAGGLTACSTVEFVMQSWSRLQQTTAPVHHGKPLN